MADRPATSSVQHATAAYGHLLDLLDTAVQAIADVNLHHTQSDGPVAAGSAFVPVRDLVEQALWFAECARELSGYQWDDLAEHLRYRHRARVQPEDDLPGPQEGRGPEQEPLDGTRGHGPPPRPIADAPQA